MRVSNMEVWLALCAATGRDIGLPVFDPRSTEWLSPRFRTVVADPGRLVSDWLDGALPWGSSWRCIKPGDWIEPYEDLRASGARVSDIANLADLVRLGRRARRVGGL
jgi:hypothetical protein